MDAGVLQSSRSYGKPQRDCTLLKTLGTPCAEVTINAQQWVCFRVEVSEARCHQEIRSGSLSEDRFRTNFTQNEGFTVKFTGTNLSLSLGWMEIMEDCDDLLVFGPPLDGTRLYYILFRRVKDE
ncbi:hypothetical protein ACHAWF_011851 [Thalassiosira exigua]